MEPNLENFNKSAEKLSKNPIGIIGLFIVLIYAMATLVMVFSKLDSSLQRYLIYFITLFPCLILLMFYRLVTKHHDKLYAPSDYKNEDNFMKTTRHLVTGESENADTIQKIQTGSIYDSKIIESLNEVKSQLEYLRRINSTNESNIDFAAIDNGINEAQSVLNSTMNLIDWVQCKVAINRYLPNFNEIMNALGGSNILISRVFGSKVNDFGIPKRFLLTFAETAKAENIIEMIKLLLNFGLDSIQYYNYNDNDSYNDHDEDHEDLFIGAYSYESLPYAKLDDDLMAKLLDGDLSMEKLKELVVTHSREYGSKGQ